MRTTTPIWLWAVVVIVTAVTSIGFYAFIQDSSEPMLNSRSAKNSVQPEKSNPQHLLPRREKQVLRKESGPTARQLRSELEEALRREQALQEQLLAAQAAADALRERAQPLIEMQEFLDEFTPRFELIPSNEHRTRMEDSVLAAAKKLGSQSEAIAAFRTVRMFNSAEAGTPEELEAHLGTALFQKVSDLLNEAPPPLEARDLGTPREHDYYAWFSERDLSAFQGFHLILTGRLQPLEAVNADAARARHEAEARELIYGETR